MLESEASWRDKVVAEPKFYGIGSHEALSTNHIQSFILLLFRWAESSCLGRGALQAHPTVSQPNL
jgi:hypothetical protein